MKLIRKLGWLASATGLALSAHAVALTHLTGSIDFSFASGAVTPSGGSNTLATATGFNFTPDGSPNATVYSVTGILATEIPVSQQVTFQDFNFNPLGPSTPTLIWSHTGSSISFYLTSITGITQNTGVLQVTGLGYLTDGSVDYYNTPGTFTIFGSGLNSTFSFAGASTASQVPDGANLLVLVGSAMAGLVGIRRFRVKA